MSVEDALLDLIPPTGMTTREEITERLRYGAGLDHLDDRATAKLLADLAADGKIRVDSADNVGPEFVSRS